MTFKVLKKLLVCCYFLICFRSWVELHAVEKWESRKVHGPRKKISYSSHTSINTAIKIGVLFPRKLVIFSKRTIIYKNEFKLFLFQYIENKIVCHFVNNYIGLLRCGKSCRLRWINYLRPDIKRGNFSKEEEDTIIQLHQLLGNRLFSNPMFFRF